MLYLVRHAKAGSRREWKGDDRARPLSRNGQRQAEALATRLARCSVTSFISSPYLRCIQTLQPTADAVGAVVTTDERLAEHHGYAEVLELIVTVEDGTVMCSHGDMIPETIEALERRGCTFTSPPEWRKGSVWVLDRNPDGEVVSASAWPPPDVG